jgi:cell division protein FtsN
MQPINASTGSNARKERNVANKLYIAIAAAIIVGLALFFLIGRNQTSMNPYTSGQQNSAAPDTAPGTNTGKPGTIAEPVANPSDSSNPSTPAEPNK